MDEQKKPFSIDIIPIPFLSQNKMPNKDQCTAFKAKWEIECEIRVPCRDSNTSDVVAAICMFCQTFGKDAPGDNDSRKRKRSTNIQRYKAPWRTDKMKDHNKKNA